MLKKIITPLFAMGALVGATSLAACNTVEGAGENLQIAGEELNDGNPQTP